MKRILFCIAACLPVLASASSYALSGKVIDKSGSGVAGIWVGLIQAKIATLTASDGSWSLGATSGIASRTAQRVAVTRHLVNEGGHLRLSFDGKDLAGRNSSGTVASVLQSTSETSAARAADAVTDTLFYVRGTSILASTVVSSTSFQAGTVALDTVTGRQSYTQNKDTLRIHPRKSISIYCSDSTLTAHPYLNQKGDALYLVRQTNGGMELVDLDSDITDNKYQYVIKLQRQSGEAGSLTGKFRILGDVYRPLITAVPDSVTRMITDDSASSAQYCASIVASYEFSKDTLFTHGMDLGFARLLLDEWTFSIFAWGYSAKDSLWYDSRDMSDSAKYNITVQFVDSSTVRLTGNTTKEVVTITGTPSTNGFDLSYVSTNSAHASGTNLDDPISCPEAVTWYSSFLEANPRTATAARVAGPSAVMPKHKTLRRLF